VRKNFCSFTLFISMLLLIMIGAGCGITIKPTSKPAVSLPSKDIVFQRYPVVDYEHSTVLGFINADGTGYVEEQGLVEKSGNLPAWSADGRLILYRWWPPVTMYSSVGPGNLGVAGVHICKNVEGAGRPRTVPGRENAVLTALVDPSEMNVKKVGIVDPMTCKVLEVIYDFGRSEDISLDAPTLSSDGLLALQLVDARDSTDAGSTIVVINLKIGEKTEIGHGVGPSWSPDGQWLAYTTRDGIYVTQPGGLDSHRIVDYDSGLSVPIPSDLALWCAWPPYAEWSPDGKWLVYHLYENGQYNIHKLNLESGEDVVIFAGGLYPYWR
jgi:hypothetical protein